MSDSRRPVVYEVEGLHHPKMIRSEVVVTSVRVEPGPAHDRVTVWNRGGNAGTLTVNAGDGDEIARRLLLRT